MDSDHVPDDLGNPSLVALAPLRAWAVGLVFVGLYALTVSCGVFPGMSAVLTTQVSGLAGTPFSDHLVWRTLSGWIAGLPFATLPLRLNLFSALCGGAAVALAYRAVALRLAALITADTAIEANVRRAARLGGAAAAVALGLSTALWSSATRLHPESLDLLWALGALNLLEDYARRGGVGRGYALALLVGLGAVESATVLVLAPYLMLRLLVTVHERRGIDARRFVPAILALGFAGAAVGIGWVALARIDTAGSLNAAGGLKGILVPLARQQLAAVAGLFPRLGWIPILVLGFVPWLVVQASARHALNWGRSFFDRLYHAGLTVAVFLMLFDAPATPWAVLGRAGHMPVLPYLLNAWVAGYLATYWFVRHVDHTVCAELAELEQAGIRDRQWARLRAGRAVALAAAVILCAGLLVGGGLHGREASGRRGAFADHLARHALASLGPRAWLASDGALDPHLSVLAADAHQPLQLIQLSRDRERAHIRELQRAIDADAGLAPRRVRLRNAADLGAIALLQEWLATDDCADARVAVFGIPAFWGEAGWLACPERLVFGGLRPDAPWAPQPVVTSHLAWWDEVGRLLAPRRGPTDYVEVHRANLRRHVGLVGVSLGVLLQDRGEPDLAYDVYRRVMDLDPGNVSAPINASGLVGEQRHAEDRPKLEAALRQVRARVGQHPSYAAIARTYGEIRAPAALAALGWQWARVQQPRLAEAAMRRAVETAAEGKQPAYLHGLAGLYLAADAPQASEAVYRRILEQNPDDTAALLGMVRVELLRGGAQAAHDWLERSRAKGVREADSLLLTAAVSRALGQPEPARAALWQLVDREPANLQAWSLLASLLIEQGELKQVEQNVLPRMQRAVQAQGGKHYLIYATRGYAAMAKGPAELDEACQAFRSALALRPSLAAIRAELLKLDFRMGDAVAGEVDARELLRSDRDHALANYLLGSILLERDDVAAAEDHFRRSVESKETALALNGMAECLRRLGRTEDAEQAVRRAVAIAPAYGLGWDTLACVLLDRQDPAAAEAAARKAVELAAGDPRLRLTLARAVAARGDPRAARAILAPLLQRRDDLPPETRKAVLALDARCVRPI